MHHELIHSASHFRIPQFGPIWFVKDNVELVDMMEVDHLSPLSSSSILEYECDTIYARLIVPSDLLCWKT